MSLLRVSGMPTLGTLGGSVASQALLNEVNRMSDPHQFYRSGRDQLGTVLNKIRSVTLDPILKVRRQVSHFIGHMSEDGTPEIILGLTQFDDFMAVPETFHAPILCMPSVRKLWEEGRIDGWGYSYKDIPYGDPYERLINNGVVEDIDEAPRDEDGTYWHHNEHRCDDPPVSFEELDAIIDTRKMVQHMLDTSYMDPTDYPNERG